MNNSLKLIDTYEVVSFDIFDTLVTRPFINPSDLFLYIEINYNVDDFYQKRINAEVEARKRTASNNEITLDDIYVHLPSSFLEYKEIECELEIELSLSIHDQVELYRYAKSLGKKIIAISDMYLPESCIINILNKHEIEVDELYLSSSYGLTKSYGNLYDLVLSKYKKVDIIHFGDNLYSDVRNANKKGIKAIQINKIIDDYFSHNIRHKISIDKELMTNKAYISMSIIAMVCAIGFRLKINKKSFWHWFGFQFAGPMIAGFVQYINKQTIENNIDKLVFVARDGYFLKKVFDIIYSDCNVKTQYSYIQRRVIQQLKDEGNVSDFIKYLDINISNKPMMIDVGTCNFTSQKFLSDWFDNMKFLYWVTGNSDDKLDYYQYYYPNNVEDNYLMQSGLIEFFMTSTELPIDGINCENDFSPIYQKNPANEEIIRVQILKELEKGIMDFANILNTFNLNDFVFESSSIIKQNNIWINNPYAIEIKELSIIKHATDSDHKTYDRMFKFSRKRLEYWKSKII